MILREATIKYAGYDPEDLLPKSNKRVCCSCDNPECKNPIRWVSYYQYKVLCHFCSLIKAHKGKKISDKTKELMSKNHADMSGDKNPNWKPKIIKNCKICNKEFEVHQARKNAKFCSQKCFGKWRSKNFIGENNHQWKEKIILICQQCNRKFEVRPSENGHKFCSKLCYGKWIHENLRGEKSHAWKGGINGNRDHVLPERDCIKLNSRFEGSEMHHIMSGFVIYIPKYIHRSIWHNMKSGQGVKEINTLAFNYLLGDI